LELTEIVLRYPLSLQVTLKFDIICLKIFTKGCRLVEVKTLTPLYDEVEDRIRLMINYKSFSDRVDYMITRNMMLKLVPHVQDYLDIHFSLDTNAKDQALLNDYAKNPQHSETIAKKSGVLLVKVDIKLTNHHKNIAILFYGDDGTTATAIMDLKCLQNFVKSLHNALPRLQWGIDTLI